MKNTIPLTYKQYILFDLDGTLIDSHEGIYNCIRYALRKMNRLVPEEKILRKFIGPVLEDSFQNILHFSSEDADTAARLYRERYAEKGWRECELYGLVKEMLEMLYERGKSLAVATSKPERYSEMILKDKGIYDYFSYISGSSLNGRNGNKTDMIHTALVHLGVITQSGENTSEYTGEDTPEGNADICTSYETAGYARYLYNCNRKAAAVMPGSFNIHDPLDLAVMIGDRKMDITGAHENNIEVIGAGYGFIQKGEFEKYEADYTAGSVEELEKMLIG